MFNLEQSIADWRKQMLSAGIKAPVPLEELEIHLREDIKQQTGAGLSESNAFEISVQRIGRADALEVEFKKVEDAKEKRHRVLVLAFVLLAYSSIELMGIHAFLKCEMSPAWRLAGWINIVLFGCVVLSILGWRWVKHAFPVISDKRVRTGIGIFFGLIGVAGLVGLRSFILPNYEFTVGQVLVLAPWFFTLMIALAVVLAGIEDAARLKRMS